MIAMLLFQFLLLAPISQAGDGKPAASTPESTDPKAVLRRCVEAITQAKTIRYEFDSQATGWLVPWLPSIRGTVTVGKETAQKAERYRCRLTVKPSDAPEHEEVDAGADGDIYFLIDAKSKTIHADMDPGVFGKHSMIMQFAVLREFSVANPFEEAFKKGEVCFKDDAKVGDEDCHVLDVQAPNEMRAEWFLSKKDLLPRRVRYTMENNGEEGSTVLTLSALVVNPPGEKDPFELVVPEGYKKTDDFAP